MFGIEWVALGKFAVTVLFVLLLIIILLTVMFGHE
jgi:hypothetical protein